MADPAPLEPHANRLPRSLWGILGVSLILNLWGNWFGLPDAWHPDELVRRAAAMAQDFSLIPHSYLYGSLHYYLQIAVMTPLYFLGELFSASHDVHKTTVYIGARSLSAVMGTGCVALVFVLTRKLFDPTAALFASLLLALSVGLVNLSHFASVDVPMVFWALASWTASAWVMKGGRARTYVLAGIFAGFAAATKYVGGIVLLSLIVAHLLREEERPLKPLLLGIAAAAIAFIAANPPIFLASCAFFEGFVIDNAYNTTVVGDPSVSSLSRIAGALSKSLGALVGLTAVLALLYAAARCFAARQEMRSFLFVMFSLAAFFAVISNISYATIRHVLPLMPLLLVLVGKLIADLTKADDRHRPRRWVGYGLLGALLIVSSLRVLSAELQITFDGRNLASSWINEHMPEGSTIEVTMFGPRISDERYVVERRPILRNLDYDVGELRNAGVYRALHPIYLAYKAMAESVGWCEARPRHYVGWYEAAVANAADDLITFDPSMAGLAARDPDLLVASSAYYNRFADDATGPDGTFFHELRESDDYEIVGEFHYQMLPWLDPELEFFNPTILIYRQRSGNAS